MVQQKDTAKVKQQRREMAQLLEVCCRIFYTKCIPYRDAWKLFKSMSSISDTNDCKAGKIQSARIRVENIIRADITTELHEMLELYCELVLARSQLLDPPSSPHSSPGPHGISSLDPALEEAVRSLIYAAPRTEVKELHAARALLVEKFGKDVALASMEGEGVAERVLSKLKVETPRKGLVDAYLSEIARFYGVPFGEPEDAAAEDRDDDDEPGDGEKELADAPLEPLLKADPTAAKGASEEDLEKAAPHPPRLLGPKSPLRITPPSPSTDNVAPKLKLPGNAGVAKPKAAEAKKAPAKRADGPGGAIPTVDDLAKRFASLKR